MYTCPENDIHSVYLDNELPLTYIKDYEEHIKTCSKCSEKLNILKQQKEEFKLDSESIVFSEKELDKSFEKLQNRLTFTKNTAKSKNVFNLPNLINNSKYVLAGIAAAAVFIFVLPVKISNKHDNQNVYFTPISRTELNSAMQVNFNSNQNSYDFYRMLGTKNVAKKINFSTYQTPKFSTAENKNRFTKRRSFACYDIFGPLPQTQNIREQKKPGTFTLHDSPTFVNINLDIGK